MNLQNSQNARQWNNDNDRAPQYEDQSEDLQKLRQMNTQFARMNQNYLYEGYEYYSYRPQQTLTLHSFETQKAQNHHQQPQIQQHTERSNSLLFTLSQKDEQQTRPTTNTPNLPYEYSKAIDYQAQNFNRFGTYELEYREGSFQVNNTLYNNSVNRRDQPQLNVFQENYQSNQEQRENIQIDQSQQNYYEVKSSGFSKYEEFAIKISKLFNIQVQDLEIIYNQLKIERQAQMNQALYKGEPIQQVQISDSEVMKKLFSYALEIKNSHNKLKNMISTIDERKSNPQRPLSHIPERREMQNISINFMLEQENRSKVEQQNKIEHNEKTKRITQSKKQKLNHNSMKQQSELQNIQSKNTIIETLVGPRNGLNTQQTIQSNNSFAESHTKSHKSMKNSRMSEKIKLISQQLESLKKQIDLDDDEQVDNQNIKEQRNFSKFKQERRLQQFSENQKTLKQEKVYKGKQLSQTSKHTVYNQKLDQQNKNSIGLGHEQHPMPKKYEPTRQTQAHVFGGQSFTYVKSIQQIPADDPQIDMKIQQTIKTCIVKSPSKKVNSNLSNQSEKELQNNKNQINQKVEREKQKIIVEPTQSQTSSTLHNQTKNVKYSFRNSPSKDDKCNPATVLSNSREKMFKSIAELRKSHSKQKKPVKASPSKQRVKTSNNPYLDYDENVSTNFIQNAESKSFIEQLNQSVVKAKLNSQPAKTKFVSKHVMKDGKLVLQRDEMKEQPQVRQSEFKKDHRKTGYFGQSPQINDLQQIHIQPAPVNNFKFSFAPHLPQPIQQAKIISTPVSHTMIPLQETHRKPVSVVNPSSLFSTKTIQSKHFIKSQQQLTAPAILPHTIRTYPLSIQTRNIEQRPQGPIVQKINPPKSPKIIYNQAVVRPTSPIIYQQKPIMINKVVEPSRPVTPINKIQNIKVPLSIQKPRSFSVERPKQMNVRPSSNIIQFNKPNTPQVLFHNNSLPSNQFLTNRIPVQPINLRNDIVKVQAQKTKRPFSLPAHTKTPEKLSVPLPIRQTLVEKPNFTPIQQKLEIKQTINNNMDNIDLNSPKVETPMLNSKIPLIPTYPMNQQPQVNHMKQKQTQNYNILPNQLFQSQKSSSKQTIKQASKVTAQIRQPQIPPLQTQNAYNLEQSKMYYGTASMRNSTKQQFQSSQRIQPNLMSSRKVQSVVHTFPVNLEQSQKMNHEVYMKEDSQANHIVNKPTYGQIITYQPPISPKYSNPPQNQPPRIPNHMRPPKYVAPKEHQIQSTLVQGNDAYSSIKLQTNPSQNNLQRSMQSSTSPPVKTYTMGHLLEASKTQEYLAQSGINDQNRSNTALNASTARNRQQQLYQSTPSFGRTNQQTHSQILFISPFKRQTSSLFYSRQSPQSRRSSSSRSRSHKKGIALESKRQKSPGHKFVQSSYHY